MKKKNKVKVIYKEDDGRTLYRINSDPKSQLNINQENSVELSREEKKAMRKAMFNVMLPLLLCVLVAFTLVFFLIKLWLK